MNLEQHLRSTNRLDSARYNRGQIVVAVPAEVKVYCMERNILVPEFFHSRPQDPLADVETKRYVCCLWEEERDLRELWGAYLKSVQGQSDGSEWAARSNPQQQALDEFLKRHLVVVGLDVDSRVMEPDKDAMIIDLPDLNGMVLGKLVSRPSPAKARSPLPSTWKNA